MRVRYPSEICVRMTFPKTNCLPFISDEEGAWIVQISKCAVTSPVSAVAINSQHNLESYYGGIWHEYKLLFVFCFFWQGKWWDQMNWELSHSDKKTRLYMPLYTQMIAWIWFLAIKKETFVHETVSGSCLWANLAVWPTVFSDTIFWILLFE